MADASNSNAYKVAIVGGGLAGSIAAAALKHAGITPVLIERQASIQDARTTAISYAAAQFLERIGVWRDVPCSKIEEIEITDYGSPRTCTFAAKDINKDAFGYIVENKWLRERAQTVAGIKPIQGEVEAVEQNQLTINGKIIKADAIFAADGRQSPLRKMLGIAAPVKDYQQSAVVGVIEHTKNHHQKAFERFLPGGPLALLPLADGQSSAMVWSERDTVVKAMLALEPAAFDDLLQERFGDDLGTLHLKGPLNSYPLTVTHAAQYAKNGVYLVGDAAHGIHPIAGQGFNLSLRDIEYLVDQLAKSTSLGLPFDHETLATHYNTRRRPDNTAMVVGTHLLNNLFINDRLLVKNIRKAGLRGVENFPPLKKFFMRYAMGLVKV